MLRLAPAPVFAALLQLACGADQATDGPLVMISGPRAFLRVELRDAEDEVLWRLVADEPAPLSEIYYGELPPGFRQQVPPEGRLPRPLEVGELLIMHSVTPLRLFHHEGFVETGQRLSIDDWEVKLRSPPGPPALDGAPPPS